MGNETYVSINHLSSNFKFYITEVLDQTFTYYFSNLMDSYIDLSGDLHTHKNSHTNTHFMDEAKLENGINKTLERYDLPSEKIYEEMFKIEKDILNGGSKYIEDVDNNMTVSASSRHRRSRSNTIMTNASSSEFFDTDTYDNDHDSFNDANNAAQEHLREALVNMCKVIQKSVAMTLFYMGTRKNEYVTLQGCYANPCFLL